MESAGMSGVGALVTWISLMNSAGIWSICAPRSPCVLKPECAPPVDVERAEFRRSAADLHAGDLAVLELARHARQAHHEIADVAVRYAAEGVGGDDVHDIRRKALVGDRAVAIGRDGERVELLDRRLQSHAHLRGLAGRNVHRGRGNVQAGVVDPHRGRTGWHSRHGEGAVTIREHRGGVPHDHLRALQIGAGGCILDPAGDDARPGGLRRQDGGAEEHHHCARRCPQPAGAQFAKREDGEVHLDSGVQLGGKVSGLEGRRKTRHRDQSRSARETRMRIS
jgi:hypothetical protein